MADKLKELKITVKKAFGKKCQLIEEFEGETNVLILSAPDFLEALKSLGIT